MEQHLLIIFGVGILWPLLAPATPNILVTVTPAGSITKQPEEDLNLTCQLNTTSNSSYNLKWSLPIKESQEEKLNYSRTTILNQTNRLILSLRQLQETDSGHYICEVTINKGLTIFRTVRLSVKSASGENRCSSASFSCGRNVCIPRRYVCDGFNDCPNGADEGFDVCGKNACEGKIYCEDGRCIPKNRCCDSNVDPDCNVVYIEPCCKRYLNERKEGDRPSSHHFNENHFLQSTVYTIVSCAVAFLFIGTLLVVAICRFQMRRSAAFVSPPPRQTTWPWQQRHNSFTARRLRRQYPVALDSGGRLFPSHNSTFLVTYRDSNGIQVLEHLPKPPPYSESLLSTDLPPPYENIAPADPLLPPYSPPRDDRASV